MADTDIMRDWQGRTMVDRDGGRVGTIEAIYADVESGQPEWALVNTGLFGTRSTFVPLAQAAPSGDDVQVPYEKRLIKDAPRIDPDGQLSEAEERELWRHYGLDYDAARSGRQTGYDTAGDDRTDRDTDDAMTRSEEELQVGTTARERGRARLRKYVTTEQEQVTVPVRREEVRVEREPVTDANVDAATRGPDISEAEHEVVLREEEPVVEKRAVPKERVRLDTDTVTEERQVGEEVRKERIEVEDEDQLRRDRRS